MKIFNDQFKNLCWDNGLWIATGSDLEKIIIEIFDLAKNDIIEDIKKLENKEVGLQLLEIIDGEEDYRLSSYLAANDDFTINFRKNYELLDRVLVFNRKKYSMNDGGTFVSYERYFTNYFLDNLEEILGIKNCEKLKSKIIKLINKK